MNIILYNYTGERNRLNKTLVDGVTITGDFNIDVNKINPTLKIVYTEDFNFNYCYIQDLKKYYFIDRININRNGFIICALTEDVITTFKDVILASIGTVTMSANSPYLQGANIPVTAKTSLVEYDFNDVFNHGGEYVLITTGYTS